MERSFCTIARRRRENCTVVVMLSLFFEITLEDRVKVTLFRDIRAVGWASVLAFLILVIEGITLLVPAPQGMGRQRPMMGYLTICLLQGACVRSYTGSYTHLGSEAASSESIP